MNTIRQIENQSLSSSQDTSFLREEARIRIEQLASDLWTDYNLHDPGITLLEVLAYAISDLGMRSQLELPDYLVDSENHSFFTAREILSNAALTINDYRRLLLPFPFIADIRLNLQNSSEIEGLYGLRVLFAKQLNESWIEQHVELRHADGTILEVEILVVPPIFQDLGVIWTESTSITSIEFVGDAELVTLTGRLVARLQITFDGGTPREERLSINTWIYVRQASQQPLDLGTWRMALQEAILPVLLQTDKAQKNVFPDYHKRVKDTHCYLQKTRTLLNAHRNLCEDWTRILPVRIQQIAIRVEELEVEAGVNADDVLADIYFRLSQFVEPPLRRNTLQKLLDQGYETDVIFEGPNSFQEDDDNNEEECDPTVFEELVYKPGFLTDEQLEGTNRGNNLYTSDVIRIIMQVPGVIAVSGVSFRAFMDRQEVNEEAPNCIRLIDPDVYYPRFSPEDCTITILRRGVPVLTDRNYVFNQLTTLVSDFKKTFPLDTVYDLPIPQGQSLPLDTYHSIQNDFPQTYRLKQGEITPDMTIDHQAKVKQFKGYLLFFEQLLANYCSQLANLGELFSTNKDVSRTYFYQPLYDVPGVEELYEAYRIEQDGGILSWEDFKHNCNQHIKDLNDDIEDRITFLERRNRFINHLLARFGEDFSEYASWSFVKHQGTISPDLIMDQLTALQSLPDLQSNRAVAFNYAPLIGEGETRLSRIWDTTNVSGFEKRVAHFLGMTNYSRRSLELFNARDYMETYDEQDAVEDGLVEMRFRFWNAPIAEVYEDGALTYDEVDRSKYDILLSSTKRYVEGDQLEEEIDKVIRFGARADLYQVKQTENTRVTDCKFYFNLLDGTPGVVNDPIARHIQYFTNRAAVEQHIQKVIHLFEGRDQEGFHIIEHVLLRPFEGTTEELQPVLFEVEREGEESEIPPQQFIDDPFSFQMSIFLPGWTPRFRDPEFRVIVEERLRNEMPVHILPWIYWVELDDIEIPEAFVAFETAYRDWLLDYGSEDHAASQDALIRALHVLRTSNVTLTNQTTYQPFSFG